VTSQHWNSWSEEFACEFFLSCSEEKILVVLVKYHTIYYCRSDDGQSSLSCDRPKSHTSACVIALLDTLTLNSRERRLELFNFSLYFVLFVHWMLVCVCAHTKKRFPRKLVHMLVTVCAIYLRACTKYTVFWDSLLTGISWFVHLKKGETPIWTRRWVPWINKITHRGHVSEGEESQDTVFDVSTKYILNETNGCDSLCSKRNEKVIPPSNRWV